MATVLVLKVDDDVVCEMMFFNIHVLFPDDLSTQIIIINVDCYKKKKIFFI